MTRRPRIPKVPEYVHIGTADHPLGERTLFLYADGSGHMLTEAYGLSDYVHFGPGEGTAALAEIRAAYASVGPQERRTPPATDEETRETL